jgi:hypothetical protein
MRPSERASVNAVTVVFTNPSPTIVMISSGCYFPPLTQREGLMFFVKKLTAAFCVLAVAASPVCADEGMWVYNNLPTQKIKDQYGFEITDAWKEHIMKSSVRFNSGGSGSFISSTGLVLTNHHVAADTLHKISTAQRDFYKQGFWAKTQGEEVPAKDLELNRLDSIVDVTAKVEGAVKPGMSPADAVAARRAVIAQIQKESLDQTGLRSDVVPLYQGGQYHLYRYKVYTDVRLVFSPEFGIAFFGGDPDNFEYPRYNLDMCIFRVYEDGKPAKIDHFLKWSTKGASEGDLIFVSGHPGTTNRMYTTEALEFLRDVRFPYNLSWLNRREQTLSLYRQLGEEEERQAQDDFFGVQNSRKVYMGMRKGLQDENFFLRKQQAEYLLKSKLINDPAQKDLIGAWDRLAQAQKDYGKLLKRRAILEVGHGFDSHLFQVARTLVRLADESAKPNAERLPAYQDAARSSFLQTLYSPAPIHKDLEIALLTSSLSYFAEEFGYDHPLVDKVLGGQSAEAVARRLVSESLLDNVDVRKVIAAGGVAAIKNSRDPMIQMARVVDKAARAVEKQYQEKVAEVEKQAYAQIAKAIFSVKGTSTYPDATFTLRLAYGTVKGYQPPGSGKIDPLTTLGGAFDHEAKHGARYPWVLPASWHAAKSTMDLTKPFNFVSTADIIGGNSGSPVINQAGELVGLIFDGNIESLTANYLYDDQYSRAVSVHSAGMLEAMEKVYGAKALVDELGK